MGMVDTIFQQGRRQPIGPEEVKKAVETLHRYKAGKARLEQRIVDNEQWWKMRHWAQMRPRHGGDQDPKPTSGWLVNVCLSKHADAMDSIPAPNMLPREQGDREEAERLSSVVPVILQQNEFEDTYSESWWYKIKQGASCTGVFWDPGKLGGLGDISIRKVDLLNLFWEPGITDLQKSRNLFHVELWDNEEMEERYPQLQGKLSGDNIAIEKYIYDDSVDTSGKSVVVDWYYRKEIGGKNLLQYCKFVNGQVLFATENEADYAIGNTDQAEATGAERTARAEPLPYEDGRGGAERAEPLPYEENGADVNGLPGDLGPKGWYDHGLYPFVMDVLFPEEGTPAGYGYIDLCKDAQEQIDLMNNAILKNTLAMATPRWFIRNDGAVNEDEYADLTKPFVHTNGNLGQDSVMAIQPNTMPAVCFSVLQAKVEEMKEISGNRDVNNGGTSAGVTAASAIAAMQEQSGKLSRDQIQNSYRAFRKVVTLVIELIRQFYTMPRQFRIVGDRGMEKFITYENSGLRPQAQGMDHGVDMGYRRPVFDIEVSAQKESTYSKMSQNELALQLYQLGFFNPEMAQQAVTALDVMDFKGKDELQQRVAQNGTLLQQLQQTKLQLASALQAIDQLQPGAGMADRYVAEQTGQATAGTGAAAGTGTTADAEKTAETDNLGGLKPKEHAFVQKAREQTQKSTEPR